jgi:hypothetical protein
VTILATFGPRYHGVSCQVPLSVVIFNTDACVRTDGRDQAIEIGSSDCPNRTVYGRFSGPRNHSFISPAPMAAITTDPGTIAMAEHQR